MPASIESYLNDASFSGTEIIILKKLIESNALTLREIAAKSGKSTGVLDQAMKKLMKKEIVTKITVNKVPKYSLKSLQTIIDWTENEYLRKQNILTRKQENFKKFMSSLTTQNVRPEIQYFEGFDGIKDIYNLLLSQCSEMLHYFPARCREEDDPLCEFRKKFTQERRKKEIFARIISEDTSLGRRFQSADYVNFRKTVLVSSERYPFFIEQIIAGHRIAYIDHENLKACVLVFSNLAHYDSLFFEADWLTAFHEKENAFIINSKKVPFFE